MGLIITPAIIGISQQYENYSKGPLKDLQTGEFGPFFAGYFYNGFQCIFRTQPEPNLYPDCEFGFMYILGYVISIFVIQITLASVSVSVCNSWQLM